MIAFVFGLNNTAQEDDFNCLDCPPDELIDSTNISQVRHHGLMEHPSISFDFAPQLVDDMYRIFHVHIPFSDRWQERDSLLTYSIMPDVNIATFEMTGLLTEDGFTSAAYSSDINIAASGNEQGQVSFWNVDEQVLLQSIDEIELPVVEIAFHPIEDWLVALHGNSQVGIYTLGEDDITWLTVSEDGLDVSAVVFSNDGEQLAIGVNTSLQIWDSGKLISLTSSPVDGEVLYQVLAHPERVDTFYTISNTHITEWIWDSEDNHLDSVSSFALLVSEDSEITSAALNHDGSLLIFIVDEQEVVAWDTVLGQSIDVPSFDRILSNAVRPNYDVVFSPDGLFVGIGSGFGISFFVVA